MIESLRCGLQVILVAAESRSAQYGEIFARYGVVMHKKKDDNIFIEGSEDDKNFLLRPMTYIAG